VIKINPIAILFRELLEEFTEEEVDTILESFKCRQETFIENFVQQKSKHSEKMGDTKSYFILDENNTDLCVLGYYALTLKVIHLEDISSKKAKSLHLKETKDQYIPTYYIALLAKNDMYKDEIDGKSILDSALATIQNAAQNVGGRVVWVEAKKQNEGVVNFYQQNGFKEFQVELQPDGQYSHLLKIV